jgi:hypothetical protein
MYTKAWLKLKTKTNKIVIYTSDCKSSDYIQTKTREHDLAFIVNQFHVILLCQLLYIIVLLNWRWEKTESKCLASDNINYYNIKTIFYNDYINYCLPKH